MYYPHLHATVVTTGLDAQPNEEQLDLLKDSFKSHSVIFTTSKLTMQHIDEMTEAFADHEAIVFLAADPLLIAKTCKQNVPVGIFHRLTNQWLIEEIWCI